LQANVTAYETLIEIHYRYYQWYSNMLIALLFLLISRVLTEGLGAILDGYSVGILILCGVFFAGSRDTILKKYYDRGAKLLKFES